MKKVVIIGAGIAGLTCGIYAQKNGFETEIYEMHTIPGGECTGWDRKGYHFDGCLHWLVGTKPGKALNKLWRDTGALDDTVQILNDEVFVRYIEHEHTVNFYTNANRLEKHLIELFPEDEKAIKNLCGVLRKMTGFGMPLDKPMDMLTAGDGLKFAALNITRLPLLSRYGAMTMKELTEAFTTPLLKRAILSAFPETYTAMSFLTTLAGMHEGDCGFPQGGSRALARRMEKKYLSLGSKVFYNAKAEKVLIENGKAVGLRLGDGKEVKADHVVSCADGFFTFKHLLDDQYTPETYQRLFTQPETHPTMTSALVFFGVNAQVPLRCRSIELRCDTPFSAGGLQADCLTITHFGFDGTMAPQGKTVIGCYIPAEYDYWNSIYKDKARYNAEKEKLAQDAKAAVKGVYPEIEGHIEVTDVVTPMTYVRYCNAWRGAWMTWVSGGKEVPRYFPGVLPGLDNFIIAGMWILPPGGLPGAGAAGRFAAHRLCIQNHIEFKP